MSRLFVPGMPEVVLTQEQEEALWQLLLREGPPEDVV